MLQSLSLTTYLTLASILTSTTSGTPMPPGPVIHPNAACLDSQSPFCPPFSPDFSSTQPAHCSYFKGGAFNNWKIIIPDDADIEATTCGQGFLDNFRGRCGDIEHWSCTLNGKTAELSFQSDDTCSTDDGTAVVAAASNNAIPNIGCTCSGGGAGC